MFKMNTKIQVLNSVDLENISGGMENKTNSLDSNKKKDLGSFSDFLNGLANPFGFFYLEGKGFKFIGNLSRSVVNFSEMFSNLASTSERAGSLTALAIFTGAIIGTYEGIKWAVKKIF